MKISLNKIILSGLFGILFFLVIVGILNVVANNINNPNFSSNIEFLNENVMFIVLISVIMLLGNIFEILVFPFNIFYPLFNAIGGVLWVEFIFRLLALISTFIEENIYAIFEPFYVITIVFVFIVVLVVGYVNVFSRLIPRRNGIFRKPNRKSELEWEDVGEEIKGAFNNVGENIKEATYDLASTVKKKLEPEKNKKSRKRDKKK
jgi:hypothetical protein